MEVRMIRRFHLLAALTFLTLTPGVRAASEMPQCEVKSSARLDDYRVSSGARGVISVQVRCPDTGRYVLRLEGGGEVLRGPVASLNLTPLSGAAVVAPVRVEVQNLPTDAPFSGSRHFDLDLWVAPGQRGLAGGQYQVQLAVRAVPLTSGVLP